MNEDTDKVFGRIIFLSIFIAVTIFFIIRLSIGFGFEFVNIDGVSLPIPVMTTPTCETFDSKAELKTITQASLFTDWDNYYLVFDNYTYQIFDNEMILTHTPETIYNVEVCNDRVISVVKK